ncbi:unnamed protein product [Cyprideis torosa]|uniref:Uncharacterized protein n=1 Tax=Cyprideis torosa TaxID=163714 RepID=A0A7R8VZZ6_9CRUS|nr:unnamed protein product [Cyprideis torosa]CAG0879194.1 unnamed protein product [Cyprideis torosa]
MVSKEVKKDAQLCRGRKLWEEESKSNGVTGPLPPSRDPVVISPPRLVLGQVETATILQRTAAVFDLRLGRRRRCARESKIVSLLLGEFSPRPSFYEDDSESA